jgi:lipoyl(octanoyl) transferase
MKNVSYTLTMVIPIPIPILRLNLLILASATVILVCHAWVPSKVYANGLLVSRRRRRKQPQQPSTTLMMISKQQLGVFEVLETTGSSTDRRVALLDYTARNNDTTGLPSLIDFDTAWEYQKHILNQQIERLQLDDMTTSSFLPTIINMDDDDKTNGHDAVIMLQHNPVYTLGTGSDDKFVLPSSCPNDDEDDNDSATHDIADPFTVPVVRMDRGGEVTYHGPGQITVYPILDLRSYRQDIHWYMRALEEAIILAISKCDKNLKPERQDDVTGVWVNNRKIAAVGIKCRRWITMHGLAVNVEESSLENFQGIVPCGLEGRKVGCINQFIDNPITVHDFSILLKEALEEVFQIELINQELM